SYRDSTDDREGSVSDGGPAERFDLEAEAEPLERRLRFQTTLARLWRIAARHVGGEAAPSGWLPAARANRQRLLALLDALFAQPRQMLRVRLAQTQLREMLANLPRLGLLRETFELLRTARAMEQARPPRGRGVTEFNHFFQAAFQEVVESVVAAAADWPPEHG